MPRPPPPVRLVKVVLDPMCRDPPNARKVSARTQCEKCV